MNPNEEGFIDRLDFRLKKTDLLFQQTRDDVHRSWDTGMLVSGIWAGVHVASFGKRHLPVVFSMSRSQDGTGRLTGQGLGRRSDGLFIDLGVGGQGQLAISSQYTVIRRRTDGMAETAAGHHWAEFWKGDCRLIGKVCYATDSTNGYSLLLPVITGNYSASDLFCGFLQPIWAAIGEVWCTEDEPR